MDAQRTTTNRTRSLVLRQAMLPVEHGAWVFLFIPLAAGLVLGGRWTAASGLLVVAALAAFLVRQPVTLIVKVWSGRRPRGELGAGIFWLAVYGLAGLAALLGLLWQGYAFLLLLLLPAGPVFAWHLWLVSRRAERHALAVELAGSAVLALAAPAAYWVGQGQAGPQGWLLWGLTWLQTAGSIVYTYLRLEQRRASARPGLREGFRMGAAALAANFAVLGLAILLAAWRVVPGWLPAAYLIQPLEVLWGIYRPAYRARPGAIGTRQLVVSLLFLAAFLLAWM